jgi:hypothetical protein
MIKDIYNFHQEFNWHSADTEQAWKENCKKFGPTWYYYNAEPITYKYNSLGYRSPEITDIKKPFFISFGCSHTLGTGLHVEDTYSYQLAQELDLQYLNFGMGGAGQNVVWGNSTKWLSAKKPKPEFVILQWPEVERLTIYTDHRINLFLPSWHGDNNTKKSERNMYLYMLDCEDYLKTQALMYYENTNLLWELAGVPTINFTLAKGAGDLFKIKCFEGWTTDETQAARDLVHPGPSFNKEMVKFIQSQL